MVLYAIHTIATANSVPVCSTLASGNWRFTPITVNGLPLLVVLEPGDYVLGAFFQNDADRAVSTASNHPPSTIAGVTFTDKRVGGPGFTSPDTHSGHGDFQWFGPNIDATT